MNSRRAVGRSRSHLAFQPLAKDFRALVVKPAPAHVDRLDLRWARRRYGGIERVADDEVVTDQTAERGEGQDMADHRAVVRIADLQHQLAVNHRQVEAESLADLALRREQVLAK